MEKIIKFPSGSLASRASARPFRDEIFSLLNNPAYERIVIDLDGVKIVSGSFADECIGIMVKYFGYEAVTQKIRLINGSQNAVRGIASAILDRVEMENSKKQPLQTRVGNQPTHLCRI